MRSRVVWSTSTTDGTLACVTTTMSRCWRRCSPTSAGGAGGSREQSPRRRATNSIGWCQVVPDTLEGRRYRREMARAKQPSVKEVVRNMLIAAGGDPSAHLDRAAIALELAA